MLVTLDIPDEIVNTTTLVYQQLERIMQTEYGHAAQYQAETTSSTGRGRPKIDISREQLAFLVDQGFTAWEMSEVLGVGKRTVQRRLATFDLSISGTYSDVNDNELNILVMSAQRENANIGIRMLKGFLYSKGHRVQRERIRQSLLRTDPSGAAQRWKQAVKRRKYNVHSPLALWHIDGNHKLIRWRIVVHGGIDGYSRIPVYIHASNNNRADTVLQLFTAAVEEFGMPSRVRSDKGGENVDVSWYMLSHPQRGPGRGSMITGKSTHNQRIERLWRDVFQECLVLFYNTFYELERCGLLDSGNEIHLWCLHYVFLPVVNRHLQSWKNAWIYHPLRTEKNSTPMQLWVKGLHRVYRSGSTVSREVFQVT
ncbi:uncharacterized protein LOC114521162 [Dendronephthya gigantea]|uniref:uncharacterized protein LOC114521162 n=1 Tax=Dendronephthya gigantea TaxID=151771 RepID=UPI0010693C01|nr:uncharacterized protein LOC114521162 [Dendronephthya gigantea]